MLCGAMNPVHLKENANAEFIILHFEDISKMHNDIVTFMQNHNYNYAPNT